MLTTSQSTMESTEQQQQQQEHSFSSEADKDEFHIILENLEEVGAIVHNHHSYMEMKQEGPNHFILFLRNNEKLYKTVAFKAVENYVEKKKIDKMCQQASEKYMVSSNNSEWSAVDHESVNPENLEEIEEGMQKLFTKTEKKKADEYEKRMKQQQVQLEEYIKKTGELERMMEEQKKEIDKHHQQLKMMATQMGVEIENQMLEPISSDADFHNFLNEKNLEITLKSTKILNRLANRWFQIEIGDSYHIEPPLKHMRSLERRRKQVVDYIEFAKTNWNTYDSGTVIQKNIHNWFLHNWHLFLCIPSVQEEESSRKEFLNKFKLEDTVGTIHFLPIHFSDHTRYFCFAISNYRLMQWDLYFTPEDTLSDLYNNLKRQQIWTDNLKFATEMEVDEEKSDIFIHTSNKDVFVENEKVVTWIKNNFNMEQQNNNYSGFYDMIPSLYNFIFNFYDSSSIQ